MNSRNHPIALPQQLSSLLGECSFEEVSTGESDASVLRVTSAKLPASYLKYARGDSAQEIHEEYERLSWFGQHAPAPKVLFYASAAEGAFLLTEALGERNAKEAAAENPEPIVLAMARALRRLHAVPVGSCPFDQNLSVKIARAAQRVRDGLVDESDFDESRLNQPLPALYEELLRRRPSGEERVVTHGDACPENFIFSSADFKGFIDCGRAGVADKYQDLALASRNIESAFGRELSALFFDAYGEPSPDRERLDYYRLLDEFF